MSNGFTINSSQVMHETIDGETIMINVATGNYYTLDPIGSQVWRALELQAPFDDIVDFLEACYEAPRKTIEAGVTDLLGQLREEELVVPVPGELPAADLSSIDGCIRSGTRFEAPKLEKHTDMQDLILLDPVHEIDPEHGWPHARA
jgi:Coenzyme PQQ synthesis protein D (PqqD)